jgi:hypothetical protein
MPEIKVGKIIVTVGDPSVNTGRLACGSAGCDVGAAAAQRFFDELTTIREALVTARKAFFHSFRTARTAEASPDEMRLLKLLVDLELVIHQQDEIT